MIVEKNTLHESIKRKLADGYSRGRLVQEYHWLSHEALAEYLTHAELELQKEREREAIRNENDRVLLELLGSVLSFEPGHDLIDYGSKLMNASWRVEYKHPEAQFEHGRKSEV